MSQELLDFLVEYNKSKGLGTNQDDLLETLREADIVDEEYTDEHRWWNEKEVVVKIGDKYIQYGWAETTGDNSIYDMGWEFSWYSVMEVEPQEKTIIVYVPKK